VLDARDAGVGGIRGPNHAGDVTGEGEMVFPRGARGGEKGLPVQPGVHLDEVDT